MATLPRAARTTTPRNEPAPAGSDPVAVGAHPVAVGAYPAARWAHPAARWTRWLLVALVVDLLLTRLLSRLAIFIPKDGPLATLAGGIGRLAAVSDALVAVVGAGLLVALLVRAGRRAERFEQVVLAAIAAVAAGGLALVWWTPSPSVVVALSLLVAGVAAALGVRVLASASDGLPGLARLAAAALAAGLALAPLARVAGAESGLVIDPSVDPPTLAGPALGVLVAAAAQWLVVGAAAGLGAAGWLATDPRQPARPRRLAVAVALAVGLTGFWFGARATFGALAIWSLGLTGVVPGPLLAVAVALAVTGLPLLARAGLRCQSTALGGGIALLAGVGLSASGLTLAGLLGLVVAAQRVAPDGEANRH
jgi:hypothetical protein